MALEPLVGTGCTRGQAQPRPVCSPKGRPQPLISPQGGHTWGPTSSSVEQAAVGVPGALCQVGAWRVHDVWGWGTQGPPARPPLPSLLSWLTYLGRLQAVTWGTLKNRLSVRTLTSPSFLSPSFAPCSSQRRRMDRGAKEHIT